MYIIVLDTGTGDHELDLFLEEILLLISTSKQLDYMLHWEIENFKCFKKEVNQKKEIAF